MASTGRDGSETSISYRSLSREPSVNPGGESDAIDVEEAQHDPLSTALPVHTHSGSEDEGLNEESEDDERDNRFQGPSSTWHFFTEEERGLAHSLNQQRANDLSIHLYNVHALKARLRDPDAAKVEHYHSKKRWIKPDEDGNAPWQPPDKWTAWPLPPDQVPRSGEKFGVPLLPDGLEGGTYRKVESWRPSGELREEILAVALRKAKERFQAQGIQGNLVVEVGNDTPPTQVVQMSGALPADADVPMADDGDIFVDFVSDHRHETMRVTRLAATAPDEDILLDDDEAGAVLQPKINQVLSQLDSLLMGLHKSRKGQYRTSGRSQSRSGRSRPASAAAKSRTRSRSKFRAALKQSEDNKSDSDDIDDDSKPGDDQPKRRRKFNPRDWSEVLGMAAFTGWDPKVVDRAAKRCSALFGEDMDFKTVPLNSITSTKSKPRTTTATARTEMKASPPGDGFIVQDAAKSSSYFCPVGTCARHNVPFDKAWRWREHLKRSHKYSNARVQRLEVELTEDANTPAVNKVAGRNRRRSRITADPVLRPLDVKMMRGKDKQPRKRKASQAEPVVIEDDGDSSESIETDSDSETGEGDDTDMED